MENNDFDKLLEEAIEEIVCEELYAIEDYIKENGPHVFSDEFENKMEKLLNGSRVTNEKLPEKGHMKKIPKMRYLLVAILILLMSGITALAYEPIRVKLENFVYTIFPDHLSIEGDQSNIPTEVEWKYPTYIPEGYKEILNDSNEISKELYLIYENEEEELLSYIQYTANTSSVVTSDGKTIKRLKIGDLDVTITMDEKGVMTAFYENEGWIFEVAGELEIEEMIKIIENIE